MGCFFSRKTYIEEKIEECESYLNIKTKNISKIKQAFFQLNEGDIIKEKALRRAIINMDLNYANYIASYVVFPFLQSFAIEMEMNELVEGDLKTKGLFMRLDEFLNKNIQSDIFDFNKIISVFYLLSNEKSSKKASELFRHFCLPNQTKMSKNQLEDFFIFLFQSVVFYSLIFSDLSSKKIILLNSKIQDNIFNEKKTLLEWLFTDTGEEEISEEYFVNRITQYEVYLGYSLMSPRGIRRRVMPFVYMRYDEIEEYIMRKNEESEISQLDETEERKENEGMYEIEKQDEIQEK